MSDDALPVFSKILKGNRTDAYSEISATVGTGGMQLAMNSLNANWCTTTGANGSPTAANSLFTSLMMAVSGCKVRLEVESIGLSQKRMAELFQKDVRTISENIQKIFEDGELEADSVIRKFRITTEDGKGHQIAHYNLDVIISVGYRVKSQCGMQFRIWATQINSVMEAQSLRGGR